VTVEDRKFWKMPFNKRIEQWCQKHFGNPKNSTWFKVNNHIIMNEKVYMYYKLCE